MSPLDPRHVDGLEAAPLAKAAPVAVAVDYVAPAPGECPFHRGGEPIDDCEQCIRNGEMRDEEGLSW